ncbi:DUF4190 domain-containing protein [Streptomyces sp. NPDC058655]|uniref:DUF4190 domain-containing protein n=1 Tax=Streptomyces sp. NPDC058655 TaxID=3346577 RepID=UPI003657E5F3
MSTPPSPSPGTGHSWPPPSLPQAWGPPPGPGRQPALNGFALASLLVGLLCLPPLGIVFGVVALVQIQRKRERGRALAITGLALSTCLTALIAFAAGPVLTAVGDRLDAFSEIADAEGELTDEDRLRPGDCFNVPGGDLTGRQPTTYKVDCSEVHHAEVTFAGPFDPAQGAGTRAADLQAEEACWKAQDAYAMDTWALPRHAGMYYFSPSRESWKDGDRLLLCVIGTPEEDQRGSLRKDRRTLTTEQADFLAAANALDLAFGRSPEEDVADALQEHQAWAREMDAALGGEAAVLERHVSRPQTAGAAAARLKEIDSARSAWRRAAQAKSPAEFDRQWERALDAVSLETEKALRGAYGLSTVVPQWLEEPGGPGGGGPGGSGGGPATGSA